MGRAPKSHSQIEEKHSYYEIEALKSKHRYADTKYRSKVQFLYGKVREMVKVKTTKDALLNDALKFIIRKENEICTVMGENHLIECKSKFLRFLQREERMWKSEKNLEKWWSKVEVGLNLKYSTEEPVTDENANFYGLCFEHSKEWASQPSEFHRFTDYAPYSLNGSMKHTNSILVEGIDYTNDLSCDEFTLRKSSKENLKGPVYTPNSTWSPTDTTNSISKDNQDCNYLFGKASHEFPSPDSCFCAVENPLEVAGSGILINDYELNNTGFVSSTFLNL